MVVELVAAELQLAAAAEVALLDSSMMLVKAEQAEAVAAGVALHAGGRVRTSEAAAAAAAAACLLVDGMKMVTSGTEAERVAVVM